ncbi:MAG: alpha/beta fold hydrolase [Deltaproteobacteria bacterium]|nr:alpha/beta fold hydrolase [Deltaproteobacteria bacterium]
MARAIVTLLGSCAFALVVGCTERREPRGHGALAACVVPGIGRPAECGVVTVAEQEDGTGSAIPLRVVRVPARHPVARETPLYLLAGGPGQAATEAFPALWSAFARMSERHDVVMVDARGTGASSPLDCPSLDEPAEAFRVDPLVDAARRCLTHVNGRRLDAYGTEAAVRDLEAVRASLGDATIDLLGVSYGTRVALAYARRHPEHLRALVLDGVVPDELVLGASFGRDTDAALESILGDCEADASCRAAFPDVAAAFRSHLASLATKVTAVELREPSTDAPVRVLPSRAAITSLVRGLAYAPELASLLPNTLAEVSRGRYQGLLGQALTLSRAAEKEMSLGLLFTVACAEDIPRITDADREAEARTTLGTALLDDFRAACALWPVAPRPLRQADAVLATPTLLLSGAADPATPPRWADTLRERLPRSVHVVVPEAGHGVWARGCVSTIVEDFLEAGSAEGLDVACAAKFRRPAFFVDRGGPAP